MQILSQQGWEGDEILYFSELSGNADVGLQTHPEQQAYRVYTKKGVLHLTDIKSPWDPGKFLGGQHKKEMIPKSRPLPKDWYFHLLSSALTESVGNGNRGAQAKKLWANTSTPMNRCQWQIRYRNLSQVTNIDLI